MTRLKVAKLGVLGAAAVLSSALAGPAMAQVIQEHPGFRTTLQAFCANHEPGNPFDPRDDYESWSAWRARGGWDSRSDWMCTYRSPARYHERAGSAI
jgi:hypothetical protein